MSSLTALEHSLCLDHNPLKIVVSFHASPCLERASPLEGGNALLWWNGHPGGSSILPSSAGSPAPCPIGLCRALVTSSIPCALSAARSSGH